MGGVRRPAARGRAHLVARGALEARRVEARPPPRDSAPERQGRLRGDRAERARARTPRRGRGVATQAREHLARDAVQQAPPRRLLGSAHRREARRGQFRRPALAAQAEDHAARVRFIPRRAHAPAVLRHTRHAQREGPRHVAHGALAAASRHRRRRRPRAGTRALGVPRHRAVAQQRSRRRPRARDAREPGVRAHDRRAQSGRGDRGAADANLTRTRRRRPVAEPVRERRLLRIRVPVVRVQGALHRVQAVHHDAREQCGHRPVRELQQSQRTSGADRVRGVGAAGFEKVERDDEEPRRRVRDEPVRRAEAGEGASDAAGTQRRRKRRVGGAELRRGEREPRGADLRGRTRGGGGPGARRRVARRVAVAADDDGRRPRAPPRGGRAGRPASVARRAAAGHTEDRAEGQDARHERRAHRRVRRAEETRRPGASERRRRRRRRPDHRR